MHIQALSRAGALSTPGKIRGDDEVRSRREGSDFVRDFDAARAFTAAGLKRGLDGVVDFVVVDPVSGRSSSRYETESESVRERSRGLAGFFRRLIFDRRAGTARARQKTKVGLLCIPDEK